MTAATDPDSGIACSPIPPGVLVTLWGEVDTALRDDAGDVMASVVDHPGVIEIDASRVQFIDSSGLAFILQLYRLGQEENRDVALRSPSPPVEDLLEIIGMAGRIPVIDAPGAAPND